MNRTPSVLFVVDINKESLAVQEAHKLGIPVVALVDTNCDPDVVDYPIPANDDAIRSVEILTVLAADAVAEGLLARSGKAASANKAASEQPMAEWEADLLKKNDSARKDEESVKTEEADKTEETK